MKIKMQWLYLCLIVAVVWPSPCAATTPEAKRDHIALLGNIPLIEQEPEYAALKGNGGGLETLQDMTEGEKENVYRPWKSRYDLKPFDLNNPDFLKPENRMGYRKFYAANPNLSLGPNSKDREAQSNVEIIFGLTALGAVIGGVLIINGMQVLDTASLGIDDYQKMMLKVVAFSAVPWLILSAWLLTVFASGASNPMRDATMVYHWQCSAMAWFILVASVVNVAYFVVHALWVSRLFFNLEQQAGPPMGRMFSMTEEGQKQADIDSLTRGLNVATGRIPRHILLFLEAACAVFGYMLITFRGGANSQLCQPEVYWATTALVITVGVVIVFSAMTFLFSVLIGVYSTSPWVQDFASSFWENRGLSKMDRHDKQEKQEAAEWKAQHTQTKDEAAEQPTEWEDFQSHFAEDRTKHDAVMKEHYEYEEAVGIPSTNPRYAVETVYREADPLVIWGDDEPDIPSMGYNQPTSIRQGYGMQPSMGSGGNFTETLPPMRALDANRVSMSQNVTASMAALNAQVDSNPNERWASQGFALPFCASPPNSAPVLTTNEPFVTSHLVPAHYMVPGGNRV